MLYYVYQRDNIEPALEGSYIWSHRNPEKCEPGFELMRKLRPGDYILHSHEACIVYASVVKECFRYTRNSPRKENQPCVDDNCKEYDAKGYFVPVVYYPLQNPLVMRWHRAWLRQHHGLESAFCVNGNGRQRYLCPLDPAHAVYLLNECIRMHQAPETETVLNEMLEYANGQLGLK